MNANYAEIGKIGNLVADFQQVLLVQLFNFSEIFIILLSNISNSNSGKTKKIFSETKFKKITLL